MAEAQLRRWRWVVVIEAALLVLSVSLLLVASAGPVAFQPGQLTWQGLLDVATALAVVLTGAALTVKAGALVDDDARRLSYNIATGLVPLLLVGMWLYQDHLRWNVLLPGLAWRSYALLFSLPPALALWRPRRHGESS